MNKQVFGNPFENYTESGERRVDLACGVSYADDLEAIRRSPSRPSTESGTATPAGT